MFDEAINGDITNNPNSLLQVSLFTGPDYLIEEEGTVSVHAFNVTNGVLPDGGLVVSVDAPNLSEFDLDSIVVDGGEIAAVRADGFNLRMTEYTVLVNLPIAADGISEDTETATFSVATGDGYEIIEDFSGGSFILSDGPPSLVAIDFESNDTISTAVPTGLNASNPAVSITGEIEQQLNPRIDNTEDIDMYAVELTAGDILRVDVDASEFIGPDGLGDSMLQVFDAESNLVARSDDDPAPDEAFGRLPSNDPDLELATPFDAYLEFVAPTDGTYYVGVSTPYNGLFNFSNFLPGIDYLPYDPNIVGSGSAGPFFSAGEYIANVTLNQPFLAEPTVVAPSTGEGPTISLAASTNTYDFDDFSVANGLVQFYEDGTSILSLGLTTEDSIPPEGVEVILSSDVDLGGIFSLAPPFTPGAEVLGGFYDEMGVLTGIRLNVTSPIALVDLALASPFFEAPTDGPQDITFTLEPSAGYVVGDKNSITTTVYDTLDDVPVAPSNPEVSLSLSESTLIESEGTETTLTFSFSEAPPEGGTLVYVDSGVRGALGDFDVFNAIVEGGVFPSPNFNTSGFYFRITEQTASITLSVFDETTSPQIPAEQALEGIEEYTFAIQPGIGYVAAPDNSEVTLIIADNPDSVALPPGEEEEEFEDFFPFEEVTDDTIDTAIEVDLSAANPSFTIEATIGLSLDLTDATDDVDMYAFQLEANETLSIDVDSRVYETSGLISENPFLDEFVHSVEGVPQRPDTELRLFDAEGNELLANNDGAAPGEELSRDPYLEFTTEAAGTYYVGVSQLGNTFYDPFTINSGSGLFFPEVGVFHGPYELTATLTNSDTPASDSIDFETSSQGALSAGDVITNQFAGLTIEAANDLTAMIFDSANPTGGDTDLASDKLGNVLIISEDGDSFDPDDNAKGGTLMFDWDGIVNVESIGLLDIEEAGSMVTLYGADDTTMLAAIEIVGLGNNSIQSLDIGTADVGRMDVLLAGSGAITEIILGDDVSVI
ncbi:MAG: PPC domain-containing protein [Cyanobacteria bacterium P01_F01_bin.150]